MSVRRLVLCAPVHCLGDLFVRKYATKEENYMGYSGPGSQNLNANSNNCLELFLGLFHCVLSDVEKSGWDGLPTQRSQVPQMHGSN